MIMSQILKFVDFPKTQKLKYLENETFFLQMKKFSHYINPFFPNAPFLYPLKTENPKVF